MKTVLRALLALILVLFASPVLAQATNEQIAASTNWSREHTANPFRGGTGLTEAEAARLPEHHPIAMEDGSFRPLPKHGAIWRLNRQMLNTPAAPEAADPPPPANPPANDAVPPEVEAVAPVAKIPDHTELYKGFVQAAGALVLLYLLYRVLPDLLALAASAWYAFATFIVSVATGAWAFAMRLWSATWKPVAIGLTVALGIAALGFLGYWLLPLIDWQALVNSFVAIVLGILSLIAANFIKFVLSVVGIVAFGFFALYARAIWTNRPEPSMKKERIDLGRIVDTFGSDKTDAPRIPAVGASYVSHQPTQPEGAPEPSEPDRIELPHRDEAEPQAGPAPATANEPNPDMAAVLERMRHPAFDDDADEPDPPADTPPIAATAANVNQPDEVTPEVLSGPDVPSDWDARFRRTSAI